MTDKHPLERCFLPLDRRTPAGACFVRVIGRDGQGVILGLLQRFRQLASCDGLILTEGLGNPTEPEISRFFETVGASWPELNRSLVERHITVWLGQLRPAQRGLCAEALMDTTALLREQGANENIIRNAYIKFMCWLRSPLGHVITGIGKADPPKVLFEGELSKYEALMLHLLHHAGCDVVYLNFTSEASYQKADPKLHFSQLIRGEILSPPPVPAPSRPAASPTPSRPAASPAPSRPAASPAPSRPAAPPTPSRPAVPPAPSRPAVPHKPAPSGPPPWAGMEDSLLLNVWAGDRAPWESILLPMKERDKGPTPKLCTLFALCFGGDERGEYRNRLFRLKRALETSEKKWILLSQKPPAPTLNETAPFQSVDKTQPRAALIFALASVLKPDCGRVQQLLTQRAFAQVMDLLPERDLVRVFNYGVRLACWLRRYTELLFEGYRAEKQPALVFYGSPTEPEAALLWALAQNGADVLCFSPEQGARAVFDGLFLPKLWMETSFAGTLPLEPFPQREERLRADTTAYRASQELDQLLYSDTGMFRDRQFTRSQPVTLKTTYDEVALLWKEEAQYRPSFRTEAGVVYVPNLFSKISGVDKGDLTLYWDRIRDMVGESSYLAEKIPFFQPSGPSMSAAQARAFLHDRRLDPKAIKASSFYHYDYLPDDSQDYILEKIQALIDYDLIVNGGADLPASIVSALMNLDKDILRLLQNFDFTREIPKFLVVDVTEIMFSLEECILLAFLNLVGFDIAVFTPTGYKNLEKHLRPDGFDTLTVGEFCFDLSVPDLRAKRKVGGGDWLGRLFGAGRS